MSYTVSWQRFFGTEFVILGVFPYTQNDFLKICEVNTLDNLPFQPYYSIPYAISFQKMHIIWAVQFSPKKSSSSELCTFSTCKQLANMTGILFFRMPSILKISKHFGLSLVMS